MATGDVLPRAQSHAGHPAIRDFGQVEPEAAPARSDVEDRKPAAVEQKLGREMALLLRLRAFEAVVRSQEIGAGIGPVCVQEQVEEPL